MAKERLCKCGKPLEQSRTEAGRVGRWPKYCSESCREVAYREKSPTTVYRLFDSDDRLLYVGATNGVKARFATHAATKEWWTTVEKVNLRHYPNRQQALVAEAEAIRREAPMYNMRTPKDVDSFPPPAGNPLLQLRIPQDLADWLEAKYPSRGEVAEYVRRVLAREKESEISSRSD